MITPAVLVTLLAVSPASGRPVPVNPVLPSRPVTASIPAPLAQSAAQQVQALETWLRDYEHWEAWFTRWRNQSEPASFASRGRLKKPAPPSWLGAACAAALDDSALMTDGCRAYQMWRRDEFLTADRRE